jgi:hypothetical protein
MDRLILPIIIIVSLILGGAYLGGIFFKDKLEASQIEAQLNKGEAVKNGQETKLGADANKVYAAGVYKARELDRVSRENEESIKSSVGADVGLSADYIKRSNDGLCRYESTIGCPSSDGDTVLPAHTR